MKKLYSIGETSKINSVSVQALRLYEKMGILTPAYINQDTGYRYYKEEQFIWIDIIKYCNYVKLPLKNLKEIIKDKDPYKIKELLKSHQSEINHEINYLSRVNNDISRLLRSMDNLENQKLLNVFPLSVDKIAINTLKVDSNLEYHELDSKMRDVEMQMFKHHIEFGPYSGVIYDKSFHPKEVFISYENVNTDSKAINKGNYLNIAFTMPDFNKAKQMLKDYIKKNNIKTEDEFILVQHVTLAVYYIFNLIVKIKE